MRSSPLKSSIEGRILAVDTDLKKYCLTAIEAGATHAKQIHPSSVVTAPWVRLKCQFGCPGYGRGLCCPPHTPTAEQTRAILDSYHRAILFHLEVSDAEQQKKGNQEYMDRLIQLEGEIFKDQYLQGFCFHSRTLPPVQKMWGAGWSTMRLSRESPTIYGKLRD